MNRRAVMLCALFFLGAAAVAPAAGNGGDQDSGVTSRRQSTGATSGSGPTPLHNGPARAARRRKVRAARQAQASVRAAAAGGGEPPLPLGDADAKLQPGRPQKTRPAGSPASKPRRAPKPRSQEGKAPTSKARVRVASSSKIAAALPKAATQLPKITELYVKAKSKQVAAILQKLAKDVGAMRLLFDDWKLKFRKSYDTPAADKAAFAKFQANVKGLADKNAKNGFFSALTLYSDLSWADVQKLVMNNVKPKKVTARMAAMQSGHQNATVEAAAAPPKSVDWRAKGKVTPVRSQGQCGSCWVFAAAGALESKVLIQSGKTVQQLKIDLAEEQLVDCGRQKSCGGGSPSEVYDFAAAKGIVTEQRYPYEGVQNQCKNLKQIPKAEVTRLPSRAYGEVQSRSATALMQAVAQQPVTFSFGASETFGSYYDPQVYNRDCAAAINHAMLLIGYSVGSGPGRPDAFWIVKNSWGTDWGEGGYVKVPMLADGTKGFCNMYEYGADFPANLLTYPTSGSAVAKPSPPPPAKATGCVDYYGQCPTWAKQGFCQSYADWMLGTPDFPGNCQKSCDMCDDSSGTGGQQAECADSNENCRYWASVGECDYNPAYMVGDDKREGYCLQSCGMCDGQGDEQAACSDWNDSCSWWAEHGECTKSADYMQAYCPYSCNVCEDVVNDDTGDCYDNDEDCSYWAGEGGCEDYSEWMSENCQASCGVCDTGCADANTYCEYWAGVGECENNPAYMAPNCALSCELCEAPNTSTSTSTTTTTTTPTTTTRCDADYDYC